MFTCKLLALDLDGTLLTHDCHGAATVSAENCKWIRAARDAGIEVVLATGRHRQSGTLNRVLQQLDIPVSVAAVNGSEIWTSNGELVFRKAVSNEDAAWLHALAKAYHLPCIGFTPEGRVKAEDLEREFSASTWLKFVLLMPSGTDPQQKGNSAAGSVNSPSASVPRWSEILEKIRGTGNFECTSSTPFNLEVNPANVNKARGLNRLCNKLKIDQGNVAAIGDGLNDVAMLRWAGLGIAMMNAVSEVRKAADRITETCEHDGVARAIEKILLR